MKIAIVAQPWDYLTVPFEEGSSIAIIAFEFARRLAQHHDVVIYARHGKGQKRDERLGPRLHIRRLGVWAQPFQALDRLLTVASPRLPPFFASRLYYLPYVLRTAREVRQAEFDTVHFSSYSQWAPLLKAIAPRTKTVLHMHGESLVQLDRARVERDLACVDLVLGCSDYITSGVQRRFPQFAERCRTVYNGVDVDHFRAQHSAESAQTRPSRVLFVGRISPEKGVHVLIEAFRLILEKRPDCRLDLVGSSGLLPFNYHLQISADSRTRTLGRFYGSTLGEKLRRQVLKPQSSYFAEVRSQLSAAEANAICFRGPVRYRDLPEWYSQADVFVFPSVWPEPFGMPTTEAMASGLPVIATRGGGLPELVDDGRTGLLVERDDPDALAAALLKLLNDAALSRRMGNAGRERVLERLSWDRVTISLDKAYRTAFPAQARWDEAGTRLDLR